MEVLYSEITGANFNRAFIQGASFEGTPLDYSTFEYAKLTGVEFSQSGLSGGSMKGAELTNTTIIESMGTDTNIDGLKILQSAHPDKNLIPELFDDAVPAGYKLEEFETIGTKYWRYVKNGSNR